MEISIIQSIITALRSISGIKYIGYYPYDFDKIVMNMPGILIKLGDTQIDAMGHRRYQYTYNTQLILYFTMPLSVNIQTIEAEVINAIYTKLLTLSTICLTALDTWTIQTGDINEYTLPSTTGYNNNILVRKLNLNYTIQKTI